MALELEYISFKPGDKVISPTISDVWVGGSALRIAADGLALAKVATEAKVVGLALNDKEKDDKIGKASYAVPVMQGVIRPSTLSTGAVVYPYAEAYSAYAIADELGLDANGKWTRTPGGKKFLLLLDKVADEGLEVFMRSL